MYAIYAYIRVVWGVNVGIYGIHGVFGNGSSIEPWLKTDVCGDICPSQTSSTWVGDRANNPRCLRMTDSFGGFHPTRKVSVIGNWHASSHAAGLHLD